MNLFLSLLYWWGRLRERDQFRRKWIDIFFFQLWTARYNGALVRPGQAGPPLASSSCDDNDNDDVYINEQLTAITPIRQRARDEMSWGGEPASQPASLPPLVCSLSVDAVVSSVRGALFISPSSICMMMIASWNLVVCLSIHTYMHSPEEKGSKRWEKVAKRGSVTNNNVILLSAKVYNNNITNNTEDYQRRRDMVPKWIKRGDEAAAAAAVVKRREPRSPSMGRTNSQMARRRVKNCCNNNIDHFPTLIVLSLLFHFCCCIRSRLDNDVQVQ